MARVYLAVQRGQSGQKAELVVLKVLRPEVAEDEHALALFTDEARIAMRLEHANVIRTRDVIADPPDYVLAMDFQNGKSLLDVVSRLGRQAIPLDEHIYILTKVLAGLSYAHELKDEKGEAFGIVHRDVSPANVLVSYNGDVKLLDFGIAKATGALAATRDGVVKGKLGYAAPEQCLGQPADPRSDIYAVGVMLWEAIARRRRASGETWQSVLQARLDDAEPALEDVCPEAPETLTAIVRKALAREPNDRYSTARDFQSDLNKYLKDKTGTAIGPARIAAMLKPHFDRDRAELHKSVEAFLRSLKGNKPARIPLPVRAAPSPAPSNQAAPPEAGEKEEHTAPIPVDTALLMLSRGETGPVPDQDSRPTALPRARDETPTLDADSASAAPVSEVTTKPPFNESATTVPPPGDATTTPVNTSTTTPAQSSISTAPPPPDAVFPSAARSTADPKPTTAESSTSPKPSPAALATPPKAAPLPTDTYGLVSVAQVAPSTYQNMSGIAPKKKAPVWALFVVGAGVIGLGAFALSIRSGSKENATAPVPTASAATAPVAAAPKPAAVVDTVNVRVSVDPPDAVVRLDNVVLSGNPFSGAVAKDNDMHELTAVAEGCKDHKQSVHLNRDLHLLVAMKCSNNAIRARARATAPRSAAIAPAAAQASPPPAAQAPPPAAAEQPAPAPEPAAPPPAALALPKDPPGSPGAAPKTETEGKYGF